MQRSVAATVAAAPPLPAEAAPVTGTLQLSCTVHQQEMTEVRWTALEGEYVIWSSLNFHHLTPLTEFEQDGISWQLHFGLGDETETSAELTEFRNLPKPAGTHSWYQVVKNPGGGASAAFAGVDALHRYFDSHRVALATKRAEIENANGLRQQAQSEAQASSPQRQTLIRFWPLKSRRYDVPGATPTGGSQGQ